MPEGFPTVRDLPPLAPRFPPSPLPPELLPLREDGVALAVGLRAEEAAAVADKAAAAAAAGLLLESTVLDSIRGVDVGAATEAAIFSPLLAARLPLPPPLPPPPFVELERLLDASEGPCCSAGVGVVVFAAAAAFASVARYDADITLTPVPIADVFWLFCGEGEGDGGGREDEDENEAAAPELEEEEGTFLVVDTKDGATAGVVDVARDADTGVFAAAAVVADPAPPPNDELETLRLLPLPR